MKNKPENIKSTALQSSPEEIQAWLDSVHFGSCCSDPVNTEENKVCRTEEEKHKK